MEAPTAKLYPAAQPAASIKRSPARPPDHAPGACPAAQPAASLKRSQRVIPPAPEPASLQIPHQTIPRGDGSFVVIPGKPRSRLTPDQFGHAHGVSAMTVRRWIRDGTIRKEFVTSRGKVGYWVAAEAVEIVCQELTARKLSQ